MSEYWKSNPRKFCDFCKCWIADNKPSIDFHEKGKKHKENVRIRLEQIGKKGKEDYDAQQKHDDYMKEMEEAALRAYKKDLEKNPDLLGKQFAQVAESKNATIVIKETEKKKLDIPVKEIKEVKKSKKWMEAKSEDGFSYYWNVDTKVAVWEPPEEGFISIDEQNDSSKPKNSSAPSLPVGPQPHVNIYNTWQPAVQATEEVDLQLPELPEEEYYVPQITFSKPSIKFEEKKVHLRTEDCTGSTSFKKRVVKKENTRNVRKRMDDL